MGEKMNAKKIKRTLALTPEELSLEKEIGAGEWTEAPTSLKREIIANLQESVAKRNREARVNIRMTPETLELIQKMAAKEGIGYQTLMGSVLHKYAHGLFIGIEDVKKVVTSLNLKKASSK